MLAVVLALLCAPSADAAVDLAHDYKVRFDGASADDEAGTSVSDAGDVNGDGRPDVIIGASLAENGGGDEAGSAYVLYGRSWQDSETVDLGAISSSEGFRISGVGYLDSAGSAVSGAGDFNGDGYDDVIVGARFATANGPGAAYVIYGRSSQGDVELSSLDPARGMVIDGAAALDQTGASVADAGDVNGDGLADVIIGSTYATFNGRFYAGTASVLYGESNPPAGIDLASLSPSQGFVIGGPTQLATAGRVGGAGDFNGDGLDDLIVGAPGAPGLFPPSAGAVYVIYGAEANAEVDLDALQPARGRALLGTLDGGQIGLSVSGAGDVNGDGLADILFAGSGGRSFVYYGRNESTVPNPDAFETTGGTLFGSMALSRAGDVDGDGRDDVLVGDAGFGNGLDSGSTFVIYGGGQDQSVDLNALSQDQGLRIDGASAADNSGTSASGVGDMNGDGRDDVIVGAPDADNNGLSSGSAYLYYGTRLTVDTRGSGSGYVSSSPAGIDCGSAEHRACGSFFASRRMVRLTANPSRSSEFVSWSGDCVVEGADCLVHMDEARAVRARFVPRQESLTVDLRGTGKGSVSSSTPGIDCGDGCSARFEAGTQVVLTARPRAGAIFGGWSGKCAAVLRRCTVSMDSARSISAQFEPAVSDLAVGPGPTAVVRLTGRASVRLRVTRLGDHRGAGARSVLRSLARGRHEINIPGAKSPGRYRLTATAVDPTTGFRAPAARTIFRIRGSR